jgi:phosphatidate cytidylyltransferase
LPHWSNPPTGEMPRIFRRDESTDIDLNDWSNISTPPAWRDSKRETDFVDLTDDSLRLGAMAKRSDDPANPFPELDGSNDPRRSRSVFDEPEPDGTRDDSWGGYEGADADDDVAPVTPIRTRQVKVGEDRTAGRTSKASKSGRDMPSAVLVGVGLLALGAVCFYMGRIPTLMLVTVILGMAAFEFCSGLSRAGHAPATLMVVLGTVGMSLGGYAQGPMGVGIAATLAVVGCLLWFLFADPHSPAVVGAAVSILGLMWIGLLGSSAALTLQMFAFMGDGAKGRSGVMFILVAVLATVAHDVFALLVGSSAGKSKLAPEISPNKTFEGLFGGMFAAIATALFASIAINQIADWKDAAAIGLAVAIAAPLGDLVESRLKRDLAIKDFGTILPGHGGILDRFDGFLFTLPATYLIIVAFDFVTTAALMK